MPVFTLHSQSDPTSTVALNYFKNNKLSYTSSIHELCKSVNKSKNSYGVLPLNSLHSGTSPLVLETLYNSKLFIFDSFNYSFSYGIYSHNKKPQTIYIPCDLHNVLLPEIKKIYPKAVIHPVASFQEGIDFTSFKNTSSVVLPQQINDTHDLPMQKQLKTTTQHEYAIIANKMNPKISTSSSVLVIPLHKNEPGLLVNILYPLKEHLVNIFRIESHFIHIDSIPSLVFYIQFQGDVRQARTRQILTYLEKDLQLCKIQILGSQTTSQFKISHELV